MFLPHFDVLCDLLLDRCTATCNLFFLYNKEINFVRIKAALFYVRRAKVGPVPFWQKRKKPFDAICDLLLDRCTATWNLFVNFTITAEIHVRSLAKFYGQYADRHMNLKFERRVSERGRAIRPFVIHSYFDNVWRNLWSITGQTHKNWRQFVKWMHAGGC